MRHLRPAIVLIVLFTLLTGLALPLGFVGLASAVLPGPAGGSLVSTGGTVVGSTLIGQAFTADKYLHGRLSATTAPDPADASKTVPAPYNASGSGGSNLGPTSKDLVERVTAEVGRLRTEVGQPAAAMPGDAVTSSASGLDPDVSPGNAAFQVQRIAKARGVPAASVQAVIDAHTGHRLLGLIGEERVNVLAVNMALDAAK